MTKVLLYDRSASIAQLPAPAETAWAGSMSRRRRLNGVMSRIRSGPMSSVPPRAGVAAGPQRIAARPAAARHAALVFIAPHHLARAGAAVLRPSGVEAAARSGPCHCGSESLQPPP